MKQPETPKDESSKTVHGKPFKDMKPREKVIWILKLSISIITFGIAFPNVMSD